MRETVKAIVIFILIFGAVATAKYMVDSTIRTSVQTPKVSAESLVHEESYMGVTKQMYLDKASNNGTDPAAVCVYDKLITENGIEATYKMDQRALADETDIDQRIFDAIEVCS